MGGPGGDIKSRNHLLITDPRATKRIRGKDKKWLPVPLIFAFIRERGDVIDYEIPITGHLKDPKFHFGDALMDVVKNIFVKPATTPYRFEVKNTERAIEKSLMIKWPMRVSALLPSQDKFLSGIAAFMGKNKEARIEVKPFEYSVKEKEYIEFFEAKKKYLLAINKGTASFSADDSVAAERMAIRDKGFRDYLDRQVKGPLLFTLQEKCGRLVGEAKITELLSALEKKREENFIRYFKSQAVDGRVKVRPKRTTVPFDGFSYDEISYGGPLPDALARAYGKMNELNSEQPRKKYLREHKKALP